MKKLYLIVPEIPRDCEGWKNWGYTVSGRYMIDPDMFEPLPEFQVFYYSQGGANQILPMLLVSYVKSRVQFHYT